MKETAQAYAEVEYIINSFSQDEKYLIPEEVKQVFSAFKDNEYVVNIDFNLPLEEQNILKETATILIMLYLKYICQDEQEKLDLVKELKLNDEIAKTLENEKLGLESLFKDVPKRDEIGELPIIVEEKKHIFRKILDRISRLFGRT
ncbi:MAG: hypothetical protein IKV94_02195 [Clostridia bacterium]|nr:hypothetical protein [Clostridia bacterium]